MNCKRGLNVKVVFSSDELPGGYQANCPMCSKEAFACFGSDGQLIWWNDGTNGCRHYRGAYASGGALPMMLFL